MSKIVGHKKWQTNDDCYVPVFSRNIKVFHTKTGILESSCFLLTANVFNDKLKEFDVIP